MYLNGARMTYFSAILPISDGMGLVFAVTSAHDVLHIGIAFRTAAFSRAEVDQVAAAFMQIIGDLPVEASA